VFSVAGPEAVEWRRSFAALGGGSMPLVEEAITWLASADGAQAELLLKRMLRLPMAFYRKLRDRYQKIAGHYERGHSDLTNHGEGQVVTGNPDRTIITHNGLFH
jgi:hypothetical protein